MRDATKFYVVIKATLVWSGKPPFETIGFLLTRSKTGEKRRKTGYLITDTNDPDGPKDVGGGLKQWTYRTHKTATDKGVTDLIVTKMKGRWEIKVSPHKSNTVRFKIDKREQIVIVANSWVGMEKELWFCDKFTAEVYNHVDISLPEKLRDQYNITVPDKGQGCLIFYAMIVSPTWNPAHVGIQDGTFVIDTNCQLGHGSRVKKHNQSELEPLYVSIQKKSPKELKDLDGE